MALQRFRQAHRASQRPKRWMAHSEQQHLSPAAQRENGLACAKWSLAISRRISPFAIVSRGARHSTRLGTPRGAVSTWHGIHAQAVAPDLALQSALFVVQRLLRDLHFLELSAELLRLGESGVLGRVKAIENHLDLPLHVHRLLRKRCERDSAGPMPAPRAGPMPAPRASSLSNL